MTDFDRRSDDPRINEQGRQLTDHERRISTLESGYGNMATKVEVINSENRMMNHFTTLQTSVDSVIHKVDSLDGKVGRTLTEMAERDEQTRERELKVRDEKIAHLETRLAQSGIGGLFRRAVEIAAGIAGISIAAGIIWGLWTVAVNKAAQQPPPQKTEVRK